MRQIAATGTQAQFDAAGDGDDLAMLLASRDTWHVD